jgi:hypothetical protein
VTPVTDPTSVAARHRCRPIKTTQKYIDLAGVVFGDEVRRLSEWYAATGTKSRYDVDPDEAQTRMESGIPVASD